MHMRACFSLRMNLTAPYRNGPIDWAYASRDMNCVNAWDISPYKFVFLKLKLLATCL